MLPVPDHTVALVERHELTEPIPPGFATADVQEIVTRCAGAAQGWADAHGLPVAAMQPFAEGVKRAGVRFEIVVGSGPDGGEGTWSPRWAFWADTLHALARRQRTVAGEQTTDACGETDAQVIPLFAKQDAEYEGGPLAW